MTALILFEYSGVFTNLYKKMGYDVIQVDKELGVDIHTFDYKNYKDVSIILAFPPCTEFAVSGSSWWSKKELTNPGLLMEAIKNVNIVLEIVSYHKPGIWFIENPIGRIEKCVPELKALHKEIFNPYEYAGYLSEPQKEAYTKKTCLWGNFILPPKKKFPPLLGTNKILSPEIDGKKLGWKTDECKKIRNLTPSGFAKAFVLYNNEKHKTKQYTLF